MSFILEALKKSDQQRQRGTTPTLLAAQVTVAAPRYPLIAYYGLLAAVLLAIGITIGWLRPWGPEPIPAGIEAAATRPVIPVVQQAAPPPPEMFEKAAQPSPMPKPAPIGQSVPIAVAVKHEPPVRAAERHGAVPDKTMPEKIDPEKVVQEKTEPEKTVQEKTVPAKIDSPVTAQEQQAMPMAELPPQIQQELPAMAVQLHAFSNNPAERLVSINSIRLREGGSLAPGLTLEQITPDGMIFSYKGYRFRRGIR